MSAFWPVAALVLAAAAAQQPAESVREFHAADEATRARILNNITAARAGAPINQVIILVRAGLLDPSPNVRMSALGAVMGRVMAARWAGTSGPAMGPGPGPRAPLAIIPAEWKGDQQALRNALMDDCLILLKGDADDRVRYQALLAVGNLELPSQLNGPMPQQLVDLFVDLYRHDPSSRIRAEVVKTFRLVPNNLPEMRAVLRDALVDPNASVRHEGLSGISPGANAASRRLTFDEARDTVVGALKDADPGVRLGAVQSLNVFGAPAAPYTQMLQRLSEIDPDARVRASARLAIQTIRRAREAR